MGAIGAIAGSGIGSKLIGGALQGITGAGEGKEQGGGPQDILKMLAQMLNGAKGGGE